MLIEAAAGQSYITFVHKLTPRVFEEDIENEPTSRAGRNFDLSSCRGHVVLSEARSGAPAGSAPMTACTFHPLQPSSLPGRALTIGAAGKHAL